MKVKQVKKATAMLLTIFLVFSFSALNLLGESVTVVNLAARNYAAAPATATVAASGTSNIKNIIIMCTPKVDTELEMIADIKANIEGGDVAIGTAITLSCSTQDAVIMYSLNEVDYAEYSAADKVILQTLPLSLKAYATKDGKTGDVSTFNYSQSQFAAGNAIETP